MSTVERIDYETLLKVVRDWPPARRIAFMQEVLQTFAPSETSELRHRATFDRALGLLAGDQPPPSDAEVARWLDERRGKHYER